MPKPRGKTNKKVSSILRVYCEGEKTEPNYLNGYLRKYFPGVGLIKIEKTNKTTPKQLVDVAVSKKKESGSLPGDEFWVVYDRESKAKYLDHFHNQAFDKASSNSINIALSNVCFEVWLLLHFSETATCYVSCDDFLKNSLFKQYLRACGLDDYEKGSEKIFSKIEGSIGQARTRAKAMNQNTIDSAQPGNDRPHLFNPYTDVYRLLDAIDLFVEKSK